MKDLSNYRKSYEKSELTEENITDCPMQLFQKWFFELENFGTSSEINAMTVATIGLDGYPKSRVVLLKKFNEEGFVFYTNYASEKGKAIAKNPNVCASFFWEIAERQIIIKGKAEKIAENLSDGYFESRPKGSQLSALVSPQSEVIPSKIYLLENLKKLETKLETKPIERPKNWGGYIIKPTQIEFWQGRPNRLHDRIRFTLQEDYNWKIERLAP